MAESHSPRLMDAAGVRLLYDGYMTCAESADARLKVRSAFFLTAPDKKTNAVVNCGSILGVGLVVKETRVGTRIKDLGLDRISFFNLTK